MRSRVLQILVCAPLALAACSSSRTAHLPDASGNGVADSGTSDAGSACSDTCTADLHGIQDCNGTVVQTCGASQGCANGTCVDACAAAAASKSSIGCEYYAVDPDVIDEGTADCYAAFVANTWGEPITISVDLAGSDLPIDGFAVLPSGAGQSITYAPLTGGVLQPNQVAILFLSDGGAVACPTGITPAVAVDAAVHGTAYGHAFHITTSAPAVAYDIFPYGGGDAALTSATLLLPTSVWDTNYIAVDPYEMSQLAGQPFIELVGSVDGTSVTITPTASIDGDGSDIAAAGAGLPATYTLDSGQVLQFTQDAELVGSVISSTQPIGLWGGASCMNLPTDGYACDEAHQEIPPVKALGHHYAAVRYRNRFADQEEIVPWRIVGAVDGTTLTYSPAAPDNAPTVINQGDVEEFDSTGYFTVESQGSANPFYMAAYMTGFAAVAENGDNRGDPEWVNMIPPEQSLAQYTFFTDPTYPETNLVLTRERVNGQFADVTIDCVGTVTGWTQIDSADDMEYTRVDLVTGDFESVGTCNNGLHTANSAQPFGLVVWAWGSAATTEFFTQAVSYAYPAGASVKPINQVIVQ